jgi:hypothetical protein
MRPAQTGQGIISEGKLEAGMAALWSIRPTNDDYVNYSLLLRRSQENCALHTARCHAVSFLGITLSSRCGTSNPERVAATPLRFGKSLAGDAGDAQRGERGIGRRH